MTAPEVDEHELTTSGRLAYRTRLFLTKTGYGTTTATEYVQGVISHFAVRHSVKHPGSPVVVSGDFNMAAPELQRWASCDSWGRPLEDQVFNTYWAKAMDRQKPGYQGTSRIDHFLLKQGSGISAAAFTLYTGHTGHQCQTTCYYFVG